MSDDSGHVAGGILEDEVHPGTPRAYFGPLKTDPQELFVHTTEDLANEDHFLGFVIGNGQMVCRLDALCSQHMPGRKTRGVMGLQHAEAWGAEAAPYHRCRPAGQIHNHLLTGDEKRPVELPALSDYRQHVDLETDVLETSFDWSTGEAAGRSTIRVLMSQVDPSVMVLRFTDRVDRGEVTRQAAVNILVPYPYRGTETFSEYDELAEPPDNTEYTADQPGSQCVTYALSSPVNPTRFAWYGRAVPAGSAGAAQLERGPQGGIQFFWACPSGSETSVDLLYVVVSDRTDPEPRAAAAAIADRIAEQGVDQYQQQHTLKWQEIWTVASLTLPDPVWQKQFEIARYTLLINTGGTWLGNIALEEYPWESHMLDSVGALNALLEWGHLQLAEKGFRALDRLYPGAVSNIVDIEAYFGSESEDEAALLPTFLTHDGRVGLYVINHFLLHSEQNAGHALGLLKLADYTGDGDLEKDLTYRWLRAYANYALLVSEYSHKQQGYVIPVWKGGTLNENEWWPAQLEGQPVEKLESIADLFPEAIRQNKVECPIDTVLSHRWVLRKAAALAERRGVDEPLRQKWLEVADQIVIPENDAMILRTEFDDGESAGVIAPELWGLFYPCEGSHLDFPAEKIAATLAAAYERRNPHIPSWNSLFYAIAYANLADGDRAWECVQELTLLQDPRAIQAQDNVGVRGFVYYYFLNYGFLLTALRQMVLRDHEGEVTLFPAIPRVWEGPVEFRDLPVGGGLRASGRLQQQEGEATFRDQKGDVVLQLEGRIRGYTVRVSESANPPGTTIKI